MHPLSCLLRKAKTHTPDACNITRVTIIDEFHEKPYRLDFP